MANRDDYAILVEPLSARDGGGYLATVPDLPGCTSDGETMEEAIQNVKGAIESWFEAAAEEGRAVPAPDSSVGKWLQRVPKTLHLTLKRLAQNEGVSLNAYITAVLAETVGRRSPRR
jgi:antitoxin HicB